jgi:hypothetical protein
VTVFELDGPKDTSIPISYRDRDFVKGGDISIGGSGEYQSFVVFLDRRGGNETTSCNVVSDAADLKGGPTFALDVPFDARILGANEDFG